MNKTKTAFFHQSGRSMIEMLGVLAIIGVLSVGGLAGYNMAMGRVRENKFVEEFEAVVFNAGETFSSMGVLPAGSFDFVDISALQTAASAISGDIQVQFLARWAVTSPYDYNIKFTKLPSSLCLKLLNISFGQPVCLDDDGGNPINIEKHKTQMQALCNSSPNTIRFMFNCQY